MRNYLTSNSLFIDKTVRNLLKPLILGRFARFATELCCQSRLQIDYIDVQGFSLHL